MQELDEKATTTTCLFLCQTYLCLCHHRQSCLCLSTWQTRPSLCLCPLAPPLWLCPLIRPCLSAVCPPPACPWICPCLCLLVVSPRSSRNRRLNRAPCSCHLFLSIFLLVVSPRPCLCLCLWPLLWPLALAPSRSLYSCRGPCHSSELVPLVPSCLSSYFCQIPWRLKKKSRPRARLQVL